MIKPARIFRTTLGVFLILFGAVGHLVPLFPGTYFIVAGVLLLSESIPAVRARVQQAEDRYPAVHTAIGKLRAPDGSLNLLRVAVLLLGVIVVFGTLLLFVIDLLRNK